VISNPVNSTVPIVAEVYKRLGVYNPARIFGVTTLDVTRAKTFVGEKAGISAADLARLDVPVVGGHAGTTIIPLLSQNTLGFKFNEEDTKALTHRIQFGGDEVVAAKNGTGSATLSMAYAGAHFTLQLLRALRGDKNIVECTYVESTATASPFFATPVVLGVSIFVHLNKNLCIPLGICFLIFMHV
jgi:malate dehydrogenase